ncbi:hypothetical protein MMC07_007819, partial [Pseudocyphellaria aurata]|nr:hypothetical protein [Pseudocyphellaria aurata]
MAHQSGEQGTLWALPGIDQDTFYAAALYLHTAAETLTSRLSYLNSRTSQEERDFLDRLADCFARSKGEDARDHVSATAMARNERECEIKLFIAKNKSDKRYRAQVSLEQLRKIEDENEDFASTLTEWFNGLTGNNGKTVDDEDTFARMCGFSSSRLEYYIKKVVESGTPPKGPDESNVRSHCAELDAAAAGDGRVSELEHGWETATSIITMCKRYTESKGSGIPANGCDPPTLVEVAKLAGKARQQPMFRAFLSKVKSSMPRSQLKPLEDLLHWLALLGRLRAAHTTFRNFCRDENQRRYKFSHEVLQSKEATWSGERYAQKIRAWSGNLGLRNERDEGDTIEDEVTTLVKRSGTTARVHCEMQLLHRFSQPDAPSCRDYFGCSKKSCWLCWQMMIVQGRFSIKGDHRKLYPRWAFPFDYNPSQPNFAEGLVAAYRDMLLSIQGQVIHKKSLELYAPFPQTSARLTPYSGPIDFEGDQIHVREWERIPIAKPKAIHLPKEIHSTPKIVDVWIYEEEDKPKKYPDFGMGGFWYMEDKSVIPAFQVRTILDAPAKLEDIESVLRCYWVSENFFRDHENDTWYKLCYRSSTADLASNPHISRIWRDVHGATEDSLPWCGDVFIIPYLRSGWKMGDSFENYRPDEDPMALNISQVTGGLTDRPSR